MRKLQCTIYGYLNGEEKEQVLEIEYDAEAEWEDGDGFRAKITKLNLLTPLKIKPSSIYEDVYGAISSDLNVRMSITFDDSITLEA